MALVVVCLHLICRSSSIALRLHLSRIKQTHPKKNILKYKEKVL